MNERIIALEVRARSFAFVVFEGKDTILDCGARAFRSGGNAVSVPADKKLAAILEDSVPQKAVLRVSNTRRFERRKLPLLRVIRRVLKARKIPLRVVTGKEIRVAFPDCPGKHEVGGIIATHFPELGWRFPPKRKPWQSEDYRMSIFDAAATGLAYYARLSRRSSSRLVPEQ